ncbi:hypothetical protein ACX80E_11210 [Arthrobacter sp. TMN-49]
MKRSARGGSQVFGGVALAGAAAILLGACTAGDGEVTPTTGGRPSGANAQLTHYTPAPAALQDNVDCLASSEWRLDLGAASPAPTLMGSVPEGFVPVEVVRCRPDYFQSPDPSGKVGQVIAQEQLTGDYTALLAALAQPSDRQDGIACTADAETLPGLWLINAAGKAVHVMWPLDACNKARGKPATAKALEELTVSKTTVLTAPIP